MRQINKLGAKPVECEECGSLWRVTSEGAIQFFPRSPAIHQVCQKCIKDTLKKSGEAKKAHAEHLKAVKEELKSKNDDAES